MQRLKFWVFGLGLSAGPAWAQYSLDYNMYFRSGISYSRTNADGVCFAQPGWPDMFGRLGNECGSYAELMLAKTYRPEANEPDAPYFKGTLTLSLRFDGNETVEKIGDTQKEGAYQTDLELANRELFAEAVHVFGKGSKAWIGRRFYKRIHIDMWDFFALENNGNGAGLMDYALFDGELSVAWLRRNRDEASEPLHNNLDLRYKVKAGDSSLETIVIAGEMSGLDRDTGSHVFQNVSGQSVHVVWESPERPYAFKLITQAGTGLYGARPDGYQGGWQTGSTINQFDAKAFLKSDPDQVRSAKAWQKSWTGRVSLGVSYVPEDPWALDSAVFLGRSSFGGRKDSADRTIPARDTFAFGLRPTYFLSKHHSLEADYYFNHIAKGAPYSSFSFASKYDGKPLDRTLHKLTLAYVLRPLAALWAKPVFRAYGTIAQWDKKQKGDNAVTGYLNPLYADETSGYNVGLQVEAWL